MHLAVIDIWGELDLVVEESTRLSDLLQVWWEDFYSRFDPQEVMPEEARQDLQRYIEDAHLVCYPHRVYHV